MVAIRHIGATLRFRIQALGETSNAELKRDLAWYENSENMGNGNRVPREPLEWASCTIAFDLRHHLVYNHVSTREMMEYLEYLQGEAKRCLRCKNPKCKRGCPISTPIPEVISLFEENRLHEAGEMLFRNNPLSAICAVVCPHEDQCKGSCIRGIKSVPVRFHEIERYISEEYLKELAIEKVSDNHRRIAVVGSGPAGITAAILLAQKGYRVTMFELRDRIGGVLTYGIPEFRLPRTIVENLKAKLVQLGVRLKPNTIVGPVITLDKLMADG